MDDKKDEVNEPQVNYHRTGSDKRTLTFFNSFEDAKDFGRRKMAEMSPKQRLESLEEMRKHFLKGYLLPNGKWPPISQVLTIKKGVIK
jgi:hypothetical protein